VENISAGFWQYPAWRLSGLVPPYFPGLIP